MRKPIAFALLLCAIPAGAIASPARPAEAKRWVCTKPVEARPGQRERKPECRLVRPIPALLDPTPLFIL